jgi:hypothetical protein
MTLKVLESAEDQGLVEVKEGLGLNLKLLMTFIQRLGQILVLLTMTQFNDQ